MVKDLHGSVKALLMSMFLVVLASTTFSVWAARSMASDSQTGAVCKMIGMNLSVYESTPPQTPAGKEIQAQYVEFYGSTCR